MAAFQENCIGRAIARLGEEFPREAELLRSGVAPQFRIHSENGWLTRVMGGMLTATARAVEKMRSPKVSDSETWFVMLGLAQACNSELGAWGRPCLARRECIRAEKAWMKKNGAPERFQHEYEIFWRNRGSSGSWKPVCIAPVFGPDLPEALARLKTGQEHNEFEVREVV